MRLVSAVAALLRRLRVERAVMALMFVVVAITSFGVAAGPRLFNRVVDDALRYEATHATASSATSSSRVSTACLPARPIRSIASLPAAMASDSACRHPSSISSATPDTKWT